MLFGELVSSLHALQEVDKWHGPSELDGFYFNCSQPVGTSQLCVSWLDGTTSQWALPTQWDRRLPSVRPSAPLSASGKHLSKGDQKREREQRLQWVADGKASGALTFWLQYERRPIVRLRQVQQGHLNSGALVCCLFNAHSSIILIGPKLSGERPSSVLGQWDNMGIEHGATFIAHIRKHSYSQSPVYLQKRPSQRSPKNRPNPSSTWGRPPLALPPLLALVSW